MAHVLRGGLWELLWHGHDGSACPLRPGVHATACADFRKDGLLRRLLGTLRPALPVHLPPSPGVERMLNEERNALAAVRAAVAIFAAAAAASPAPAAAGLELTGAASRGTEVIMSALLSRARRPDMHAALCCS